MPSTNHADWPQRLAGDRFFNLIQGTHFVPHEHDYRQAIDKRLGSRPHGRDLEWQAVIDQIAALEERRSGSHHESRDAPTLKQALLGLHPWRKGPFTLRGVRIDSEWQSQLKWARLQDHIQTLEGRFVLDVGSGNGYYLTRMVEAGAELAVGIDPTRLFFYQFEAVCLLSGLPRAAMLPLMDEDLPSIALYDTVFSMGVLYHRRNPLDHLACIKRVMRAGAELVLETLIVEDESRYPHGLIPTSRYAKMRNVWSVPTIKQVIGWLQQAGFQHARVVDVSPTTTKEQRRTPWMTFESLSDFLDPQDESKTIEGYPGPVRAIVIAER